MWGVGCGSGWGEVSGCRVTRYVCKITKRIINVADDLVCGDLTYARYFRHEFGSSTSSINFLTQKFSRGFSFAVTK